jgi:hypothetical protein
MRDCECLSSRVPLGRMDGCGTNLEVVDRGFILFNELSQQKWDIAPRFCVFQPDLLSVNHKDMLNVSTNLQKRILNTVNSHTFLSS